MIFFVTPSTVLNRKSLEMRRAPKPFLKYSVTLVPKIAPWKPLGARMLFEHQIVRYALSLSPFPIALAIWPHLALPISQAPLLMFIVVWLFETRFLGMPRETKKSLASADDIGRIQDVLRVRGQEVLSRFAASRGLRIGELHLVIEQSELARIPPLTYVSVQTGGARPAILDLSDYEKNEIADRFFEDELLESELQRIGFARNDFLNDIVLDPSKITSHARLAALARA